MTCSSSAWAGICPPFLRLQQALKEKRNGRSKRSIITVLTGTVSNADEEKQEHAVAGEERALNGGRDGGGWGRMELKKEDVFTPLNLLSETSSCHTHTQHTHT